MGAGDFYRQDQIALIRINVIRPGTNLMAPFSVPSSFIRELTKQVLKYLNNTHA